MQTCNFQAIIDFHTKMFKLYPDDWWRWGWWWGWGIRIQLKKNHIQNLIEWFVSHTLANMAHKEQSVSKV
jgi:hypothetical protein